MDRVFLMESVETGYRLVGALLSGIRYPPPATILSFGSSQHQATKGTAGSG